MNLMAKSVIRRFMCIECPYHKTHNSFEPIKIDGRSFNCGDQYCIGGKKAKRFRPSDPKVYPPTWCPRRKSPIEYRVYAYKDRRKLLMHQWYESEGLIDTPYGSQFFLRTEGNTNYNASAFQKEIEHRHPSDILGIPIHDCEVIEIDDGLEPYYFHVTKKGIQVLFRFNANEAKQNKYQENTPESPT